MQCCWLRQKRVLLLSRNADNTATVAQDGRIVTLSKQAAALLSTVEPPREDNDTKRAKTLTGFGARSSDGALRAVRDLLVASPNTARRFAAELGISNEIADEVAGELLASYAALPETNNGAPSPSAVAGSAKRKRASLLCWPRGCPLERSRPMLGCPFQVRRWPSEGFAPASPPSWVAANLEPCC